MKLHNTLTRQVEEFKPLHSGQVRMYTCGPTVYDHAHVGNISSYIYADTLRRLFKASGFSARHVMNFTDVDDKTIRRSREKYPELLPEKALHHLTREYTDKFLIDMETIGNDIDAVEFVSATESIEGMRQLISDLYKDDFAYIASDGVYFSIQKYRDSGKTYGQLTEISAESTSSARISNDEYDKESVHDFALWKKQKDDEPAWSFELDGHDLTGRPGWHIECSVMSVAKLGMPFDIHTAGVDLIFPHHENEIAQSTAGNGAIYAKYFFHNEHLLVDGKKMSKSLHNFYTLRDIQDKGYDPLAFRLLVLQSHYRNQSNFSWENLEAAQNRLKNWRAAADLRWQLTQTENAIDLVSLLHDDLDTPKALAAIDRYLATNVCPNQAVLDQISEILGIHLLSEDLTAEQKQLIKNREIARSTKDWDQSDKIRDDLKLQGIELRDSENGTLWTRT